MSNEGMNEMIGDLSGDEFIPNNEEEFTPSDLFKALLEHHATNEDIGDNDFICDDDDEIGDSIEYHDRIMYKAKAGNNFEALSLSEKGLEKYPKDMNLLADAVRFAGKIGDVEKAEHYLNILTENCDMHRWDWQHFTYTIDFLMNDISKNSDRIKEFIENYKKILPNEEKSVVAEAEFNIKIGYHGEARKVLEDFVERSFHAPQCAIKLITMYLQNGEFERAKHMMEYYEVASNELQSSTNYSIQLYESVVIEHALLRKKKYEGQAVKIEDYKKIKRLFEKLMETPKVALLFASEIKDKINGLELEILRLEDDRDVQNRKNLITKNSICKNLFFIENKWHD